MKIKNILSERPIEGLNINDIEEKSHEIRKKMIFSTFFSNSRILTFQLHNYINKLHT